jgi:hypothetical protein
VIHALPAKHIYLANRHPRLDRAAFAERWVQHSRIGESLADDRLTSSISSLRYCLAVDPAGVLASATNEHDGVALLSLRSIVSIPALHDMVVTNDIALADELRVFERPVEEFTMYAASEILIEGAETQCVVIDFARRRAGVSPVDFFRQADDHHSRQGELETLAAAGVRRWVRNAAIAPAARGFAYDAINEYWFESLDSVADGSAVLDAHLSGSVAFTERGASTTLVTTVIVRLGRDRP